MSDCSEQLFSEDRVKIGVAAFCSQTDRQTDTHTQTNRSKNITPPQFRGGVTNKKKMDKLKLNK